MLLVPFLGYCQLTVKGPDCVTPGTVYQYTISANWDSASTLRLCIAGGTMVGENDSCTANKAPVSFVQVVWNNGISGRLSLVSSVGSAGLDVRIAWPLSGGSIGDSCKNLTIGYDSIPPLISCSASKGGECSPGYVYQWQLSIDNINWADIDGATGQQLSMNQGLQKTSYCRRKVTESVSGSIAYSDAACVIVTQPN